MIKKLFTILSLLLLFSGITESANSSTIRFSKNPVAKKDGDKVKISFSVSEKTDVEVAILDSKGIVVRHLVAGVLGGKFAPPKPLKKGFSQNLTWDGKDDFGDNIGRGVYVYHLQVRSASGDYADKYEKLVILN